jgi:hypothetical protein
MKIENQFSPVQLKNKVRNKVTTFLETEMENTKAF